MLTSRRHIMKPQIPIIIALCLCLAALQRSPLINLSAKTLTAVLPNTSPIRRKVAGLTSPGSLVRIHPLNPEPAFCPLKWSRRSSGAGRGPEVISNSFTHYGRYSARIKYPTCEKNSPRWGLWWAISLIIWMTTSDSVKSTLNGLLPTRPLFTWGHGRVRRVPWNELDARSTWLKELSTKTNYREGHKEHVPHLQEFKTSLQRSGDWCYDASSKFYTYGLTGMRDHLRWWMLHPTTADTVVGGTTAGRKWEYAHKSRYRLTSGIQMNGQSLPIRARWKNL